MTNPFREEEMFITALRINKPPIFQFSDLPFTQLMQLSDYFTNTDNCQKSKFDKRFN